MSQEFSDRVEIHAGHHQSTGEGMAIAMPGKLDDGENRMTAFQGGGGAAGYSYDGNGMRVVKSVSGGTTTVSIFAGSSVIAEYDNGAAPGAPTREYVYNGAGSTTGLLAMFSGGATTYYQQDHLSVRLTTDANGNVLTQEGSFPFGEQWYESGPGNKWFFTSYNQDSESGLNYALARYYDSRTGTFCSADPLAGDPSDPQSWNRYPYGRNDPIDITDPSGKSWWSNLLIDIGIGIGAAVLPELAPEWFGAAGLFDTSTTAIIDGRLTLTVTEFSWSTAIATGAVLGGLPASAPNAPQPSQPQKPRFHNPCSDSNAMAFTQQHAADAAKVAQQLHVPTANVLGLSGQESLWGANRFAIQGNNFFSLQGNSSAPFATGQMGALNSSAVLSQFPSYLASAQSFGAQYGSRVFGLQDPSAFAKALTPKFNNLNAAKGGDPKFIPKTASAIQDTQKRLHCLGLGG